MLLDPALYLAAALFYLWQAHTARRDRHPFACYAGLAAIHLVLALKKLALMS